MLVPGNFPIGCMPSYLTVFGNGGGLDEKGCKSELNEFAQFHNQHLQDSLTKLSQENPNITMVYADYYNTFLEMVNNPGKYGKSTQLKILGIIEQGVANDLIELFWGKNKK